MGKMQSVTINDDFFQGAVSLEHGGGGIKPWRIPYQQRELFAPKPECELDERAETSSGVRLRFQTDSRVIGLEVAANPEVPRKFDLVYDNNILETVELEAGETELTFSPLGAAIPQGQNVLEIWLVHNCAVTLRNLRIAEGAALSAAADNRKKWITYGSSITHCGGAHSPAQTWPGIVARSHDLNLTSLGYGGQCHLDGMIARMIREMPADIITLKLGINMYNGHYSFRTYKPAIISFISIVREKHPDIPIGVISPIFSPDRETTPGLTDYTLEKMRDALAYCVDILTAAGDKHLHYFDGLSVFNHELASYLPDDLHPNGDGYVILGNNIDQQVMSKLV